jgi:hypothetical protein
MKKVIQFSAFIVLLLTPVFCYAALPATMIWEVRPGGSGASQNNAGGYCGVGHTGDDQSITDANHFNTTALKVTAADQTKVWNSSGTAFDVNDCNNVLHVTAGTGWTAGWYQVTAVDGNATATLDRVAAAAPTVNSGTACLGGAHKIGGTLDDEFTEMLIGGNYIYVKTGSYTAGESVVQATDFSARAPVKWIGYTATRGDATVGDDRPLIACTSTNAFTVGGSYSILSNLRFTIGAAAGLSLGSNVHGINLKVTGSGAVAITLNGKLTRSEAIAAAGTGISFGSYGASAINCYVHDSVTGYVAGQDAINIESSVADTCTTGINCVTFAGHLVKNNTIYNCTTGISGSTGYSSLFINNIITDCADGAKWTTVTPSNIWEYNCFNNTYDVNGVTAGATDLLATDPLLTKPAGGDFTLQASSPCLNAGAAVGVNTGAVGAYKMNIGVDQDDNTAAGGGGGTGHVIIF